MSQIRKRLTYANVMSSIAVFLVLGGATALAASKIGSKQLKANSVTTGKIKKSAVTTSKIKTDAVTGAKVKESTLGTVPNADKLGGATAAAYQPRAMWATVSAADDDIVAQSGGISIVGHEKGQYFLQFPQDVVGKAILATPISSALGSPAKSADLKVAACGDGPESAPCTKGGDTPNEAFVATFSQESQEDVAFYIVVLP